MLAFEEVMSGAWETNQKNGFVGTDPAIHIALMHSELSEALEEIRAGKPDLYYLEGKPEGQAAELADTIIRICSYCKEYGIPLEKAIAEKMNFNKNRPFKHGGKRF